MFERYRILYSSLISQPLSEGQRLSMSTDTVNNFYELVNDLEHPILIHPAALQHTRLAGRNTLIHILVLAASARCCQLCLKLNLIVRFTRSVSA